MAPRWVHLSHACFLPTNSFAIQRQPARNASPTCLRTFEAIDAICIDGDGLKWFNCLYLQVTRTVETRVASGTFSQSAWLSELDVQFARLYLSALEASLSGQPTPGCLQTLFARRDQTSVARIQFALAGINAHINHDLPEAIVATCESTAAVQTHGTPTIPGTYFTQFHS
jgi:Family of unknown function (DUF5995)